MNVYITPEITVVEIDAEALTATSMRIEVSSDEVNPNEEAL